MKKLLCTASLFLSLGAIADSSTGCGLGSLIWKDNSIVSGLFRLTTNHSFSTQLFGITSGTSGCTQHSIVKADMAPMYFAEANLPQLQAEMAQGQGEYLTAFSQTFGCDQSGNHFSSMMKNNYSKINFEAPEALVKSVKDVMKNDNKLVAQCSIAFI